MLKLPFMHFGGVARFSGEAVTVDLSAGVTVLGPYLDQLGRGRILVVDAHGDRAAAVVGDRAIELAVKCGWGGIIINGALRDSARIAALRIGVLALGTSPRRAPLQGKIDVGIPLNIEGCRVTTGSWVYADTDGVLISPERLDARIGSID